LQVAGGVSDSQATDFYELLLLQLLSRALPREVISFCHVYLNVVISFIEKRLWPLVSH